MKLLYIIIAIAFLFNTCTAEPVIPMLEWKITPAKKPQEVALALQILCVLTILALLPSILIMFTSFVRVVVVLSLVRNALALQMLPPQQVIVGLALFLTFFIMAPTFSKINDEAIKPYLAGKITLTEALKRSEVPLRQFMFSQTREKDIELFMEMGNLPRPKSKEDVPTYVLAPAFMISELVRAFEMGILVFVPFIMIDMVVASVLMSMGMIMLPPVMISMPFKILLFVLVDGWHMVVRSIILSYR